MHEQITSPFVITLTTSLISLSLIAVTGIPSAYYVGGLSQRCQRWIDAALMVPIVLPPTVVGFALITIMGRHGPVGGFLYDNLGMSIVFTKAGGVLAASVVSFPLLYRSARAAFSGIDKSLLRVSRTLGKGELAIFFRISLPLAKRGLIAGSLIALVRAMGEFGATLMVAGNIPGSTQTMPLAIFESVQAGNNHEALILCMLAGVAAFGLVFVADRVTGAVS